MPKPRKLILSLQTGLLKNDPTQYRKWVENGDEFIPHTEPLNTPWNLELHPTDTLVIPCWYDYESLPDAEYLARLQQINLPHLKTLVHKLILCVEYELLHAVRDTSLDPPIPDPEILKPKRIRTFMEGEEAVLFNVGRETNFTKRMKTLGTQKQGIDWSTFCPWSTCYMDRFRYKSDPIEPRNLSETDKQLARRLFQSCNLYVMSGNQDPNEWCIRRLCEHAGILRTFPTITDMDYTPGEGQGDTYPCLSKDMSFYLNVQSANVIRYIGSDDACDKGRWSEKARFLQVCQTGFNGTWAELHHPVFRNVLLYMSVSYNEPLTNTILADMAYFQNLVTAAMNGLIIEKSGTFTIPPMPELMHLEFSLECKEHRMEPCEVRLRIVDAPNLRTLRFTNPHLDSLVQIWVEYEGNTFRIHGANRELHV